MRIHLRRRKFIPNDKRNTDEYIYFWHQMQMTEVVSGSEWKSINADI